MRTYIFNHVNSSANLTISANNFDQALVLLEQILLYPDEWRVENKEGELE